MYKIQFERVRKEAIEQNKKEFKDNFKETYGITIEDALKDFLMKHAKDINSVEPIVLEEIYENVIVEGTEKETIYLRNLDRKFRRTLKKYFKRHGDRYLDEETGYIYTRERRYYTSHDKVNYYREIEREAYEAYVSDYRVEVANIICEILRDWGYFPMLFKQRQNPKFADEIKIYLNEDAYNKYLKKGPCYLYVC